MLSIFPFAIQKKETYLETENCIQEVCWGTPRGSNAHAEVVKGGRMSSGGVSAFVFFLIKKYFQLEDN